MKFLVNADDFGKSSDFNAGVRESFKKGIINRTTIMVNMPDSEEARDIAFSEGFADRVGLHLNFVEGRALSKECRKSELCDVDGFFKGEFYKGLKGRFFLDRKTQLAIKKECEAQVKKYIDMGFTLMHADSHNYTHTYWSVAKNVRGILKKYKFTSVRISHNIPPENISFPFKIYKYLINNFVFNWRVDGKEVYKTKYFGSLEDYLQFSEKRKLKGYLEIMVHTRMNENGIIDDVEIEGTKPMPRKEWFEEKRIKF